MPARGRRNRSLPRLALAGAALLIVAACLENTIVQVTLDDVAELRLGVDSMNVPIGYDVQAQALTLNESGTLLVGLLVDWSTLDSAVATVDDNGLVTGVASGTTNLVAGAGGFADTAIVVVAPPPVLVLSAHSSLFTAQAGQADPTPDTIDVTNGGAFPLVGLAVDSIVYESTEGWLAAALGATAAPTELELTATTSGLTAADVYTATVWVSATDADDSPDTVQVVLDLQPGPAASIEIDGGEGQSGQVGLDLPTDPSVLVKDALNNPVEGAEVTFAVTGGGGSVGASADTTDASGIAHVSWTLGGMAGPNTMDATVATVGTVTFNATGEPGPATHLQIDGGNGQSAIAGSPVTTSPSVVALDAFDNPIEGVAVTFEVTSGGGSITGSPATTDASGIATAGTWTLETVGANTLDAIAASIPDTVTFTATGIVGSVDDIVLVAGDAQIDTVAATLAIQYAVRVDDINDNPIPSVTVSWEVTGGGGTIGGGATSTSDTDGSGIAVATRVLGTGPGTHTARVTIGGLADTVYFAATANVGTPSQLVVTAGGAESATVATTVGTPPTVKVGDKFGNGIGGYSLDIAVVNAGGSASPTGTVATQSDGTVAFSSWTLGTKAATASDTIEVTPSGGTVAPNPLQITATATAGAPTSIAVVGSTDNQTAISGNNVSLPPTVVVSDLYSNPVPDVRVDFSPNTGSSVGAAADTTDATGQALTTWNVTVSSATMQDDGTFPHTLTATVNGTAINTSFTGSAIYSYTNSVLPVLSSVGDCAGCHGSLTRATFYNVASFCSPSTLLLDPVGGLAAEQNSLLTIYLIGLPNPSGCTGHNGGTRTGPTLEAFRAWVRNGAPNN